MDRNQQPRTAGEVLGPPTGGVAGVRARLDFQSAREKLRTLDPAATIPVVLKCSSCKELFAGFTRELTIFDDELTVNGRSVSFGDLDLNLLFTLDRDVTCEHCGAVDDYTYAAAPLEELQELIAKEGEREDPAKVALAVRLLRRANAMTTDGRTLSLAAQLLEFSAAAQRNPDDIRSGIRLVNLWGNLRQAGRARALADMLLETAPGSVELLGLSAKFRLLVKQVAPARARLRRAAEIVMARADRYHHEGREDVLQGLTAMMAEVRALDAEAWSAEDQVLFLGMQKASGLMIFDKLPAAAGGRRTVVRPTVTRNDPCVCGSGRKYRKCCRMKLEGR